MLDRTAVYAHQLLDLLADRTALFYEILIHISSKESYIVLYVNIIVLFRTLVKRFFGFFGEKSCLFIGGRFLNRPYQCLRYGFTT